LKRAKTIVLIVSLAANALFVAFFISAVNRPGAVLSFRDLDSEQLPYTTAALIVSVPSNRGSVALSPVSLTLQTGDTAAFQLSSFIEGRQANFLVTALYDRRVVTLTDTGYGILIEARAPGKTVVQTVSADGISDLAVITVTE
jgi:hypothetical protein